MDRNPISQALGLALAPVRLAGRVASTVAREATGGRGEPEPPPRPPKDLDDVAIARKVESAIFRSRTVAKGKVDVNVADGVVWLRGEVKTPDLVRQLEAKAYEVPEVKGVENLLHLPKTPAPSRTDTPTSQRKTRRTKPRPGARKVSPGNVSEEAPAPAGAEPTPKAVSAAGGGRKPAPLGSHDDQALPDTEGPDTADLDDDAAHSPKAPGLHDLKGG